MKQTGGLLDRGLLIHLEMYLAEAVGFHFDIHASLFAIQGVKLQWQHALFANPSLPPLPVNEWHKEAVALYLKEWLPYMDIALLYTPAQIAHAVFAEVAQRHNHIALFNQYSTLYSCRFVIRAYRSIIKICR